MAFTFVKRYRRLEEMTTRSILKGTFRLSIVAAILAALYCLYVRLDAWGKEREAGYQMLVALECGAQLPEARLKTAVNAYGNIDLGKVGCADRSFIASFDEIERTKSGAMKRELTGKDFQFGYAAEYIAGYAFIAFVLINLAGLAVGAARGVMRWIVAGYRSS
jgi:hypothetical protein